MSTIALARLQAFLARYEFYGDVRPIAHGGVELSFGDLRKVAAAFEACIRAEEASRKCRVHDLYQGAPCGRIVEGMLLTRDFKINACRLCGQSWARSVNGEARFVGESE